MNKLYKVELKSIGTIITDKETLDNLRCVILDAAGRSSNMAYYAGESGNKKEAEQFLKEFDQRLEDVDVLDIILSEVNL